jgi:hypothetical protein
MFIKKAYERRLKKEVRLNFFFNYIIQNNSAQRKYTIKAKNKAETSQNWQRKKWKD